jgi:hypothetical protein
MPKKLFVICVGDLATIGGLVLVVTPVWPLPDSFSFCLRVLGTRKFIYIYIYIYIYIPWRRASPVAKLFLRHCDVSRTSRGGRLLSGHILGRSVSALPDYGLLFVLIPLPGPWTGYPTPPSHLE